MAAGLAAAIVGLATFSAGTFERQELNTVDARFDIRGARGAPAEVAVVAIDDDTLAKVGRFPFRRSLHAKAIEELTRAGARVIAYDVQFSERTADAEDRALQDAIVASKRVVLATTGSSVESGPNILFPDDVLARASARVGDARFPERAGGAFRRVPRSVEGLPSFAVVAAEVAAGRPISTDGFRDGAALIDYRGPGGSVPSVSFADLLAGRAPRELLVDRVVVVGTTAPRLQDIHQTPVDGTMSGPEINANAVATLLRGVPLRDAPRWAAWAAVLLGAALVTLVALRWSSLATVAVALAAIAGYLVAAQLAFNGGRVLDVVHPLLAVVLTAAGATAVNFATVDRERRRLRTEFARFVPASVVGEVVEQAGDSRRLGGRRLYATVLFSDLRGFSAAAERLPPEHVIELLNRYLTEMSDAILDHGGTVVSYLGDGIMAVFGAPIEQADHADRALAAAREMLGERLASFNRWVATSSVGQPFRIGVGLASGPVMSGNVGSERRLEYAAVGDTTNTAARLQSLTKETRHALLVADSTRAALTRPAPDLAAVGALELRGHQLPTSVWTLPDAETGPGDAPGPAPVSAPG